MCYSVKEIYHTLQGEGVHTATARAHADSEKLKAAMSHAGVESPPECWFAEDVEDVSY